MLWQPQVAIHLHSGITWEEEEEEEDVGNAVIMA